MARYDYSRYSKNLKKTTKPGKTRIFCRVADDGTVYVCNAYAVYELSPAEYREFVQPSVLCDPGNWVIDENGERRTLQDGEFDFIKLFRDAVNDTAPRYTMQKAPFLLPAENKTTACGFYAPDGDFCVVLNAAYIDVFDDGMRYASAGAYKPMLVYWGEYPIAMVLPIRYQNTPLLRAVKAYFCDSADDGAELRRENKRLHDVITEQDTTIARLDKRIAELESENTSLSADVAFEREYSDAKRTENENLYLRLSALDDFAQACAAAMDALRAADVPLDRVIDVDAEITPEEYRAALDSLNAAQNAANAFTDITDADVIAEAERRKNDAQTHAAPQIITVLPFRTFTTQTGPQSIACIDKHATGCTMSPDLESVA